MSRPRSRVELLEDDVRAPREPLPFRVVLRGEPEGEADRVIGRAATIALAMAIFQAAKLDFPGRRITLNRGAGVIEES